MSFKYIAFVLDEESRQDLIKLFPCSYGKEVCHHITISFGDSSEEAVTDARTVLEPEGFP